MARKRVALVLSGGVSLGTYIAGALDELLVALNAHSDEYVIDIITGASAGATTAAIVAYDLLYRGGKTGLYRAWVEQIDFVNLLDRQIPTNGQEPVALFHARQLHTVANETLDWGNSAAAPVRAPACAENLIVGMTLTNVDALPYVARIRVSAASRTEDFTQYRHAEQQTFHLSAHQLPDAQTLKQFKQVSIASAAFPFVFPMVKLRRRANDPNQYIQSPNFEGEAEFWYYDGGTFNNLPIDLAWHHIRQIQGSDRVDPDRLIIVIDPSREGSPKLSQVYPNLPQYASKLLQALRTESSAIQFDREVLRPSLRIPDPTLQRRAETTSSGVLGSIPGVDRAEVDVLDTFALVLPEAGDRPLHGSYLGIALSGFLDRKFREYDFRRGAADARRVVREVLKINSYDAQRPDGEQFYHPDDDPQFAYDLSSYTALDRIPSSHDPQRSVREVFETALQQRVSALIGHWNPPGLNLIYAWGLNRWVRNHLPDIWIPQERPTSGAVLT